MESLRRLAKDLGVSQPFLSQIRAGKRPLPDALRVKVEALGAYHVLIGDKQPVLPSAAPWGRSSAGRAPALQAGGRAFESPRLHQRFYQAVTRCNAEP